MTKKQIEFLKETLNEADGRIQAVADDDGWNEMYDEAFDILVAAEKHCNSKN